jgi:hypothetical protein
MSTLLGRPWLFSLGLGVVLAVATDCPTWWDSMILPSGHYLEHPPQFIPPDPSFPLPNELAHQEEDALRPEPGPGGPP